ncbi:ribose 5-phosphate isomerase B [Candidatus Fermentibacteria bacterium]|nr:ribose 5-phosphate isomerase B [Candidatus Fermentibacteria bacterium]
MRIALGSDHAGFPLKSDLARRLAGQGHEVLDMGCFDEMSVDYPDQAGPVCDAVLDGRAERGVLVCNTGIGMSIAANRRRGIRAALCLCTTMAAMARRHNDANVLVLGAGLTAPFLAHEILEAFLAGAFEGGRHARRVEKLDSPNG